MRHDDLLDSDQGCHAPISVKYDLAGTFDTAWITQDVKHKHTLLFEPRETGPLFLF